MKIKLAMVVLAGVFASCGVDAQASRIAHATLAAPIDKADVIVVDDKPWRCDGVTCSGPAGLARFDDRASCRQVAQKVGIVAAFDGAKGALATDELAHCNKFAKSSR